MKKRWLISAVMALSLVAAGCSDSDDDEATDTTEASLAVPVFTPDSTMDKLQKKGKIVAGVKFDQPGFGQKNPTTGGIEGFDIEVADLIAQAIFGGTKADTHKRIEFIESVSKNREPFIADNKVDMVVATYTINNTRKQVVDFAGPYYVAHGDIMVKKDNTNIQSVTDLNGKRVCTVKGSTYEASLKSKAPQADVTLFDTYSQCQQALIDDRVVAVTTDNVILAGLVQAGQDKFKLVNTSYTDEPYGIGLKLGDNDFREFLNKRLETISGDGSWKKAYESTLGKLGLSTPTPPAVDRYVSAAPTTTTAVGGATTTTAPGTATTAAPVTTTTMKP